MTTKAFLRRGVAVETKPRAAADRQAWFLDLLRSSMKLEVSEVRAAAFPADSRRAEELVARCMPKHGGANP